MIFTSRKELVHGDLLVDDKPEHVEKWSSRWGKCSVLWAQPYNSDADCRGGASSIWRTDDWESVREHLRQLRSDRLR